jgi:hypothetical protein
VVCCDHAILTFEVCRLAARKYDLCTYENSNVVVLIAYPAVMQNEKGEVVDLYIPRKWYVMFGLVAAARKLPTAHDDFTYAAASTDLLTH